MDPVAIVMDIIVIMHQVAGLLIPPQIKRLRPSPLLQVGVCLPLRPDRGGGTMARQHPDVIPKGENLFLDT